MRFLVLFVSLIFINICTAQGTIGDYSYVEVPDRFEFLSGDNKYQLSDMMVYYIEKKGIEAYRKNDSPNVPKCNVLYADIDKNKSLFLTKLAIVFKDCNGEVVFKSNEGSSKSKDHAKMYPDALRQAFKSFTAKDVERAEAKLLSPVNPVAETVVKSPKAVVVKNEIAKTRIEDVELDEVEEVMVDKAQVVLPQATFTNYQLNGKSYLLKKVATGYSLFATQAGNDNFIKVGDLSLLGNGSFKMIDIYGETKEGVFNAKQDLVIKLSSGVDVTYKKEL